MPPIRLRSTKAEFRKGLHACSHSTELGRNLLYVGGLFRETMIAGYAPNFNVSLSTKEYEEYERLRTAGVRLRIIDIFNILANVTPYKQIVKEPYTLATVLFAVQRGDIWRNPHANHPTNAEHG